MSVNLKGLIGKLNQQTRGALEAAAGLCVTRTHYDVEIEHYLLKLLDTKDGDFPRILKRFEVDPSRLAAELTRSLDTLKTGNARTPAFSPSLVRMLLDAWILGSLDYGAASVRGAFTVLALLTNDDLAAEMLKLSSEFSKIKPEVLRAELFAAVEGPVEDRGPAAAPIAQRGIPEV